VTRWPPGSGFRNRVSEDVGTTETTDKSSTMRLLVEDLVRYGKPVCVIDPKDDWWGVKLNRSDQVLAIPSSSSAASTPMSR
jgi:hypothetical protein